MKTLVRLMLTLVVALSMTASLVFLASASTPQEGAELKAYRQINQELGVVLVNPTDGKRFVSFALRVHGKLGNTPALIEALDSLKDIPGIRGVNLDMIPLNWQALVRLTTLRDLEALYVADAGLSEQEVADFRLARPSVNIYPDYASRLVGDAGSGSYFYQSNRNVYSLIPTNIPFKVTAGTAKKVILLPDMPDILTVDWRAPNGFPWASFEAKAKDGKVIQAVEFGLRSDGTVAWRSRSGVLAGQRTSSGHSLPDDGKDILLGRKRVRSANQSIVNSPGSVQVSGSGNVVRQ